MSKTVVRWLDADGAPQDGGASALGLDLSASPWIWVDIVDPGPDDLSGLESRFDLHPLALEDAAHPQRRAKLDVYPSGLFLVWITPTRRRGDSVSSHELDAFIGRDYLVTLHDAPSKAIETVASEPLRTLKGGPDWTLHSIIDQSGRLRASARGCSGRGAGGRRGAHA